MRKLYLFISFSLIFILLACTNNNISENQIEKDYTAVDANASTKETNVSTKSKPLYIVLLGAPGSGKSTSAHLLSDRYNIPVISTGKELRKVMSSDLPLGKAIAKSMNNGELLEDEIVLQVLYNTINNGNFENGFILEGFPRRLSQALELDKLFSGVVRLNGKIIIINLSANEETILERVRKRVFCANNCNVSQNNVKDYKMCSRCVGGEVARSDDKEEIVRDRFKIYREETKPVAEYYKFHKSDQFINIDTDNKDMKETYNNVVKKVDELRKK